jgi:hypothetical protein
VPQLSPLLDVQEIDLASDRLTERRRTLPERDERQQALTRAQSLDGEHAQLLEQREALDRAEHALGAEVAAVAGKAKEVEDTLYSGSVKAPKELEALQHEIRLLRERQSSLEEQEMELLEEIEQTESHMQTNRSQRSDCDDSCEKLEAAILAAEGQLDGELAGLAGRRAETASGIPVPVLAEYDRLRTKERLAGRVAVPFENGSCGGCRVKLPVTEQSRIKQEPDDALVVCVHCGRLLVR